MDLRYPAEAEAFRAEIRSWLEENLPEGWGEPGFERSSGERERFQEESARTPAARGRTSSAA